MSCLVAMGSAAPRSASAGQCTVWGAAMTGPRLFARARAASLRFPGRPGHTETVQGNGSPPNCGLGSGPLPSEIVAQARHGGRAACLLARETAMLVRPRVLMSRIIISYRRSDWPRSQDVSSTVWFSITEKTRCSWTSTTFRLAPTSASTSKACSATAIPSSGSLDRVARRTQAREIEDSRGD